MNTKTSIWVEGIRAFLDKKPRAANPYIVTTGGEVTSSSEALASSWFSGWDIANIISDGGKRIKRITVTSNV